MRGLEQRVAAMIAGSNQGSASRYDVLLKVTDRLDAEKRAPV